MFTSHFKQEKEAKKRFATNPDHLLAHRARQDKFMNENERQQMITAEIRRTPLGSTEEL